MERRKIIAVAGSGSCDKTIAGLAHEVGRLIAGAGCALICGGLGGVMESACKGAWQEGGLTLGILPGEKPGEANNFVAVPIATGMGTARNVIIVKSAGALIAISGGPGTLSEIAHAVQSGVPVIGLSTFEHIPEIIKVKTPAEAVEAAVERMKLRR